MRCGIRLQTDGRYVNSKHHPLYYRYIKRTLTLRSARPRIYPGGTKAGNLSFRVPVTGFQYSESEGVDTYLVNPWSRTCWEACDGNLQCSGSQDVINLGYSAAAGPQQPSSVIASHLWLGFHVPMSSFPYSYIHHSNSSQVCCWIRYI